MSELFKPGMGSGTSRLERRPRRHGRGDKICIRMRFKEVTSAAAEAAVQSARQESQTLFAAAYQA